MERKIAAFYVVFGLFFATASFADTGGFLGKNLVEARRVLRDRVAAKEKTLVWARSLSALVFLERLSGNEGEATKLWAGCDRECRKQLPSDERAALEAWQKHP